MPNDEVVRDLLSRVGRNDRGGREARALRSLVEIRAADRSPGDVAGGSMRIIADLLQCDKARAFLRDDEAHALVAAPTVAGAPVDVLGSSVVDLDSSSLVSAVHRTKAPLVSNNEDDEQVLGVPLRSGSEALGVLVAINPTSGSFGPEDVEFASVVAGHLGNQIAAAVAQERDKTIVQRLRELDYTRSDFISTLAHELKGPMTTIIGFSQMLQRVDLPEGKRREVLEIVEREVERLSRLVGDFLDMSRIEAGSVNYSFEPVDIRQVVESVLSVHPSIGSRHSVSVAIPEDFPPVLADPDRIRQVLLNMLTNATRYSPSGSVVTVEATVTEEPEGSRAQISVIDQGIGIADEDKLRVFSKFVMLDKPSWVKTGTGLGLYITRGIIEAHAGRIWVQPGPEGGSAFRFTLPLAA